MDKHAAELVMFEPGDPEDPKNWSARKKRWVLFTVSILAFGSISGSSFYAPSEPFIRTKYGINPTVSSLGLTLYVLGFALGPLIWGPLSEIYGRAFIYKLVWPLIIIFTAPTAWVNNAAVIIVFRLFAGIAAGMPLTNGPAGVADIYSHDLQGQGIAVSYFILAAFTSTVIAPLVGYFIAARLPNDPWPLRVHLFLTILLLPLAFLVPETHASTILIRRARKLRTMGHPNAFAPHELHKKTPVQLVAEALIRPAKMLFTEPLVQGTAIWTALSYGILYFSLESYPVIFVQQHHFSFQLGGLPFLPIIAGMVAAVLPYVHLTNLFIKLKLPRWMGGDVKPDSPEARLKLALFGCICLPVSSFWLAWTSGPETHWIAPTLSGFVFGFANVILFFTFSTYTGHSYTIYTGSASAATVFLRSIFAAIFPLFSHSLLEKLGTKWGVSLFGFIAFGLIPIPIIFLRYGARLRQKSPYIQEALSVLQKMQAKQQLNDSEEDILQELEIKEKGSSMESRKEEV